MQLMNTTVHTDIDSRQERPQTGGAMARKAANRLRDIFAIVIAGCFLGIAPHAGSQTGAAASFPTKPIVFIVPFPPGGATDLVARLVGQKLRETLGQPVVIENKPGAGGNIGTAAAAKAAPNGYTLLLGSIGPFAVAPSLYKTLPFDPIRDFAPVTIAVSVNNVLVVNPSLPIKSVKDLVAAAKASPGKLNYGSSGAGATDHLAGEVFKDMAGLNLVHVPFKGGVPAMTALLSGDIQLSFATAPTVIAYVKAGKMRALAVTGAKRLGALPDVPTINEAGVKGYDVTAWYGILQPAGTPTDIVLKLNGEIGRALKSPDVSEKLNAQGLEPWVTTPEQFAARIRDDLTRWTAVVRKLGITAE